MHLILLGAIAMASCVVGLFFLRFWRTTGDRFFLLFAAAFLLEGIERVLVGAIPHGTEQDPLFYLLRLAAFLIILLAIFYKNRAIRRQGSGG